MSASFKNITTEIDFFKILVLSCTKPFPVLMQSQSQSHRGLDRLCLIPYVQGNGAKLWWRGTKAWHAINSRTTAAISQMIWRQLIFLRAQSQLRRAQVRCELWLTENDLPEDSGVSVWGQKTEPEGVLILKMLCANANNPFFKKSLTSRRPDAADTHPLAPLGCSDEQG